MSQKDRARQKRRQKRGERHKQKRAGIPHRAASQPDAAEIRRQAMAALIEDCRALFAREGRIGEALRGEIREAGDFLGAYGRGWCSSSRASSTTAGLGTSAVMSCTRCAGTSRTSRRSRSSIGSGRCAGATTPSSMPRPPRIRGPGFRARGSIKPAGWRSPSGACTPASKHRQGPGPQGDSGAGGKAHRKRQDRARPGRSP